MKGRTGRFLALLLWAAWSGPVAAQTAFEAAVAAYERGDFATARQSWQNALAAGDWDAARSLGHLYRRGLGTERDYGRAAEYYQQAFDHGVVNAALNLAELYLAGRGVPQQVATAKALLQRAAEQGSDPALFRLEEILEAERTGVAPPIVDDRPGAGPVATPVADPAPPGAPAAPMARLQLAAYRSSDAAMRAWAVLGRPALSPEVVAVDIAGRGRYFRLFAVGPAKLLSELCPGLQAKGEACLIR